MVTHISCLIQICIRKESDFIIPIQTTADHICTKLRYRIMIQVWLHSVPNVIHIHITPTLIGCVVWDSIFVSRFIGCGTPFLCLVLSAAEITVHRAIRNYLHRRRNRGGAEGAITPPPPPAAIKGGRTYHCAPPPPPPLLTEFNVIHNAKVMLVRCQLRLNVRTASHLHRG